MRRASPSGSPGSPAPARRRFPGCSRRSCAARGSKLEILDGDIVRENLSKGLGFSKEDRDINIRRIAFVADLLSRNGVPVITAAISPYAEIRDEAHETMGDRFIEVYVEGLGRHLRRARRQGPLRESILRRDQGIHRRLRPLRDSREPRLGLRHRERDSRGVGAEAARVPRVAGPDPRGCSHCVVHRRREGGGDPSPDPQPFGLLQVSGEGSPPPLPRVQAATTAAAIDARSFRASRSCADASGSRS